jgi:glycosyltransferase involved in cell wall biosynthesis
LKELPEAKPGRSDVPAAPSELSGDPITHVDGEGGSNQGWDHPNRFTILKIAPTFFFADYGCHVRILEEIRVLQSMGHRAVVCTYPSGQDVEGIDIRRADYGPWHPDVKIGPARRKLYLDPLLFIKASRVASQIKPNVVHAHLHDGALIGFPVSRACRVPLVFDFQGSLTSEMLAHGFLHRNSPLYHMWRLLEDRIDRLPDAIITSTANSADLLMKRFNCPSNRVFTVADCVNTDTFVPRWAINNSNGYSDRLEQLRVSLGVPLGYKLVVYVGLLQEYQGISHLLLAAQELAERHLDVHFLIMGYPGLEKYRNMADELGISNRVTFTGRVPYHQLPQYLALGDVAVSPKMSETEGNGKLLNYMAMGLPTVVYDTPVNREILGDLGIYARFGDHRALSAELEAILYNSEASRALGEQLRSRAVSMFSWTRGGKLIEKIYEFVIGR